MAVTSGTGVVRSLAALLAAAGTWWWMPWPTPGSDPVVDMVAVESPWLYMGLWWWHYTAPAVAVVGAWGLVASVGRVWVVQSRGQRGGRGELPRWPVCDEDGEPALVVGEVHHPVRVEEAECPEWLVVPGRGLYTGIAVFGAVGSGKTSACMRPFARQLLSWKADDESARMAGLVLEVKGDFCQDIEQVLEEAGRGKDYVEIGIGGKWQWNPLSADWMDSYSLAYTIASLLNQLFGKGNDPFWPSAYVNAVRWIIEIHRMRPGQWVTLRDVYRCMLDPDLLEERLQTLATEVRPTRQVEVRSVDLAAHASTVRKWHWTRGTGGVMEAVAEEELEDALRGAGVSFEVVEGISDPERAERLEAAERWYEHDWMALDAKLRTTVTEGLSVFLAVFDLPDVARIFCPDRPGVVLADLDTEAPVHEAVSVVKPLPPLNDLIETGRVIALNMPAGTNPALSRAVGVMLKQAWLQALMLRPAEMKRNPERYFRPALFLCDEYQAFCTVGESDPAGDEKAFAVTRQSRLIPIVATQSISSLRAAIPGGGEAWRALIQTLRTRVFLSLADDATAQIASAMCGTVPRIKASYTVSEQTGRAAASLLSGSAGGGIGSVGASKGFSERREPLFHPRDFAILENCQAIVLPFDGRRSLDARRVYLKPDFLPRDRPYWQAREAGEL